MSHIIVEVPDEVHKAFRIYCIQHSISMTEFIRSHINALLEEKRQKTVSKQDIVGVAGTDSAKTDTLATSCGPEGK